MLSNVLYCAGGLAAGFIAGCCFRQQAVTELRRALQALHDRIG